MLLIACVYGHCLKCFTSSLYFTLYTILTMQIFLSLKTGRRLEVPAVCILIIDGSSSDSVTDVATEIQKHCRVIAIGLGRKLLHNLCALRT